MLPPELLERFAFGGDHWEASNPFRVRGISRFASLPVVFNYKRDPEDGSVRSVSWAMLAELGAGWDGVTSSPADLDQAGPIARGVVKSDGCADTRLDFHACGQEDVHVVLLAVAWATDGARALTRPAEQ